MLTLARTGRDVNGRAEFDRFTVAGDGSYEWRASRAGGAGCIARGGLFAGRATAAELGRLEKLATDVQDEVDSAGASGAAAGDLRASRTITTALEWVKGEKFATASMRGLTPSWRALGDGVGVLEQKAEPLSAVELSVRTVGPGELEATFKLLGSRSFALPLPREAGEAFFAGDARVSYARARHEFTETELTPEARLLKVRLRLAGGTPGRQLRYDNSGVTHHQSPIYSQAIAGAAAPRFSQLDVCARW